MDKNKRKKITSNLILILTFMVIAGQIAMMHLGNTIVSQVSEISKYGFFATDITTDDEVIAALHDWNLDFRPNTCKLISMYDENLNLTMRFEFMDTPETDLIYANTEFREYVENNEQGYLDVGVNGTDEHVFFRWTEDPHGTGKRSLVVVRVAQPTYLYVWAFPLMSCLNILVTFILIIVINLKRRQEGIDHYMTISRERRYL